MNLSGWQLLYARAASLTPYKERPYQNTQYIFLDFAESHALRRTKIPVRINETGEAYLNEEDIRNFLITQLERTDISIYSLEVLGY